MTYDDHVTYGHDESDPLLGMAPAQDTTNVVPFARPVPKNLSPTQFSPTSPNAPDVPAHIVSDRMKSRRFALARDRETLSDADIDILDEAAFGGTR